MGGVLKAFDELRLADHMIYVTLSLLDDKRIFHNAVNHLGNAIRLAIREFMARELDYKRLRFMPPEELIINEFLNLYSSKLGLSNYAEMLKNITSFNDVRSKSSIKLKKNDKFIVISPEYSMVALTLAQVKDYIRLAKEFINKLGCC